MTDNQFSQKFNAKPIVRRRQVRPEQVSLNVERVEHLIIEVQNAQPVAIDALERRIAIIENSVAAAAGMPAQPDMFSRIPEALRGNGAAHK